MGVDFSRGMIFFLLNSKFCLENFDFVSKIFPKDGADMEKIDKMMALLLFCEFSSNFHTFLVETLIKMIKIASQTIQISTLGCHELKIFVPLCRERTRNRNFTSIL